MVIEQEYKEIYRVITDISINIIMISKRTKISIIEINQKLLMMEIKGYIKSLPENEYVRV